MTATTTDIPNPGNLIGGQWVPARSGETFENRNPADTDDLVALHAASDASDLDAAFAAASEAFPGWRATPGIARGNILYKAAEILASRVEHIARELTREEGKTLKEATGETMRAVAILRYYAGETAQPHGEMYPSASATTMLYTLREPLGVVTIITPWNFPIAIPAWKLVPAIAFGNAVVIKPASDAPLCTIRLAEALVDAGLPAGVLNVVTGSARALGDGLVTDERSVAVSFTGSDATGKIIREQATAHGKKVQLELGGKNPAIVLADADMDHALTQVINGAMMSTGQKCTATSRAIVDRAIASEFTQRLADKIGGLKVGNGLDGDTQIGPLINAAAAESVADEVAKAKSTGTNLLVGGERMASNGHSRGHFVAPALFDGVTPDSRLGQHELFGPVLGVIPVDGLDEAVAVANGVRYGLSASLFTRDLTRAMTFVREIQAGIVHVNSETAGAEPQVPFGGYKGSSSYSREQGKAARDFFTQVKTVYLDPSPA
ncbi:MAG TPA: aldehyde dehydrogenase family protein [Thermomicrobiales bacterium]|jgi:aldehyde dehydrogenase (NAD+)|nr:aldehyde dehydrogenase family protein [Thermomicrobiales bacterium]